MTACVRCHRPRATSALWDHPGGCECVECLAHCFDSNCFDAEPQMPAAGAWVRVAEGCEMPVPSTTIIVWHCRHGASLWSVGPDEREARRDFLIGGLTHWAPLHAPEEERK